MKILAGLLLSIACFSVLAQPSTTKGMAGYVEFDDLAAVYGEPKVRINIGEKLLHFVARMDQEQDKDTAQMFEKLKAVRVEVYKVNENTKPAIKAVDKVARKLQSQDWEPIVMVTDEHSHVRIFVKLNNDNMIDGLVMMAVGDNDEAVFINIIGQIDPSQVAKVTKALNIDVGT